MYIKTNLGGTSRKALINTMEQLLNQKATYCGAPSFGYKFDCGIVDREGTFHLVASLQGPTVHNFARVLEQHGFSCTVGEDTNPVSFEIETPIAEEANEKFCIHIKRSDLEAPALERFTKLIESKSTLLKKALQVGELPIHVNEEQISLAWFDAESKANYPYIFSGCDRGNRRLCQFPCPDGGRSIKDPQLCPREQCCSRPHHPYGSPLG